MIDRVRVLLVDDDDLMRAGLRAVLSTDESIEVVGEGADGRSAVSTARALRPDVVLMDLSLPIVDGWEATRQLKNDIRTAHIPIVALTAHDGAGELQRATRAGCDWFVPKPCPPDALITELRRVLAGTRP